MTVLAIQQWLQEHLLTDVGDVEYLCEEEQKFYDSLLPSTGGKPKNAPSNKSVQWNMASWLQLIECAIDDHACKAFMVRHVSKNRMEVDSQWSEVCLPEWEEVVTALYNDKNNKYWLQVMLEFHSDFMESHWLWLEDTVVESITPQQVID
jgi:hypothetical protein